jgi:DNA-directed RNA polymerase specialized sigma24 family protein
LAAIISKESGRPIATEVVSALPDAHGASQPSDVDDYRRDAMSRLFDHYGSYGITGNPNVLAWLLGRAPRTFRNYVRRSLSA